MERKIPAAFVFLGVLITAAILAGCLYDDAGYGDSYGPRWKNRDFTGESFNGSRNASGPGLGNLTEEQHQQFAQARLSAAIHACQGKSEGEACVLDMNGGIGRNDSRTGRIVTGTCETAQGSVQCRPDFRRPPA